MSENVERPYLTRKQAADLLQLPVRTLDYLAGTNQIPFLRISKRNVRFAGAKLDKWFEQREGIAHRRGSSKDKGL
ncbi:MAG: helix-turn-helix domain-containing protein [Desulfobacteraceae bacterium]|nr:helix-turn-helix domain-containing protein [Desulfobacteraceae bacterium]